MAGAYEISCPDSQCPKEGIFLLDEIEKIVGKELSDKYKGFRLNTGQYIIARFNRLSNPMSRQFLLLFLLLIKRIIGLLDLKNIYAIIAFPFTR